MGVKRRSNSGAVHGEPAPLMPAVSKKLKKANSEKRQVAFNLDEKEEYEDLKGAAAADSQQRATLAASLEAGERASTKVLTRGRGGSGTPVGSEASTSADAPATGNEVVNRYQGFCPFKEGIPLAEAVPVFGPEALPSDKEVFAQFVRRRRPCVLRQSAKDVLDWDIWGARSNDALKERAGHVELQVEIRQQKRGKEGFGEGRYTKMKFGDFLDKIFVEDETSYYLTTQPIKEGKRGPIALCGPHLHNTALGSTFTMEPKLLGNLVPYQFNLWLGHSGSPEEGTSTGLHHDFHDNLYAVVRGKKEFRLYPPTVTEALRLVGSIVEVKRNGLITYESGLREDGASELEVAQWTIAKLEREIALLKARQAPIIKALLCIKGDASAEGVFLAEEEAAGLGATDPASLKAAKAQLDEYLTLAEDKLEKAVEVAAERMIDSLEAEGVDSDDDEEEDLRPDGFVTEASSQGKASEKLSSTGDSSVEGSAEAGNDASMSVEDCSGVDDKTNTNNEEDDVAVDDEGVGSEEDADSEKGAVLPEPCPPGEKPFHFNQDNTIPRDSSHESQVIITQPPPPLADVLSGQLSYEQLLSMYITVTLEPGDCLYLPASWFHEVISYSESRIASDEGELGHMALNWWFHPPSSLGTFHEPYQDGYRASRFKRLGAKMSAAVERTTALEDIMRCCKNQDLGLVELALQAVTDGLELDSLGLSRSQAEWLRRFGINILSMHPLGAMMIDGETGVKEGAESGAGSDGRASTTKGRKTATTTRGKSKKKRKSVGKEKLAESGDEQEATTPNDTSFPLTSSDARASETQNSRKTTKWGRKRKQAYLKHLALKSAPPI